MSINFSTFIPVKLNDVRINLGDGYQTINGQPTHKVLAFESDNPQPGFSKAVVPPKTTENPQDSPSTVDDPQKDERLTYQAMFCSSLSEVAHQLKTSVTLTGQAYNVKIDLEHSESASTNKKMAEGFYFVEFKRVQSYARIEEQTKKMRECVTEAFSKLGAKNFHDFYGDSFINQIEYGQKLIAVIEVNRQQLSKSTELLEKVGISVPLPHGSAVGGSFNISQLISAIKDDGESRIQIVAIGMDSADPKSTIISDMGQLKSLLENINPKSETPSSAQPPKTDSASSPNKDEQKNNSQKGPDKTESESKKTSGKTDPGTVVSFATCPYSSLFVVITQEPKNSDTKSLPNKTQEINEIKNKLELMHRIIEFSQTFSKKIFQYQTRLQQYASLVDYLLANGDVIKSSFIKTQELNKKHNEIKQLINELKNTRNVFNRSVSDNINSFVNPELDSKLNIDEDIFIGEQCGQIRAAGNIIRNSKLKILSNEDDDLIVYSEAKKIHQSSKNINFALSALEKKGLKLSLPKEAKYLSEDNLKKLEDYLKDHDKDKPLICKSWLDEIPKGVEEIEKMVEEIEKNLTPWGKVTKDLVIKAKAIDDFECSLIDFKESAILVGVFSCEYPHWYSSTSSERKNLIVPYETRKIIFDIAYNSFPTEKEPCTFDLCKRKFPIFHYLRHPLTRNQLLPNKFYTDIEHRSDRDVIAHDVMPDIISQKISPTNPALAALGKDYETKIYHNVFIKSRSVTGKVSPIPIRDYPFVPTDQMDLPTPDSYIIRVFAQIGRSFANSPLKPPFNTFSSKKEKSSLIFRMDESRLKEVCGALESKEVCGALESNAYSEQNNTEYEYGDGDFEFIVQWSDLKNKFEGIECHVVPYSSKYDGLSHLLSERKKEGPILCICNLVEKHHWVVLCFTGVKDKEGKEIVFYKDSLESNQKFEEILGKEKYQVETHKGHEQTDKTSCGVFAIQNAILIANLIKDPPEKDEKIISHFQETQFCKQEEIEGLRKKFGDAFQKGKEEEKRWAIEEGEKREKLIKEFHENHQSKYKWALDELKNKARDEEGEKYKIIEDPIPKDSIRTISLEMRTNQDKTDCDYTFSHSPDIPQKTFEEFIQDTFKGVKLSVLEEGSDFVKISHTELEKKSRQAPPAKG